MLAELSIRNVAIIDQLNLSFSSGLNVLSGETGAGKSIIIDALTLVCGGRASADLIRSGEEEATVEAVFDISALPYIQKQLEDAGIEAGNELIVRRVLSRSGKNRVYMNGSLATLGQLTEIGRQLVTIHGQHESQGLLRSDSHILLLDTFAGATELSDEFSTAYARWRSLEGRLLTFEKEERDLSRKIDLLSYQINEIQNADLKHGEEEELEEKRRLLVNAERLAITTGSAYEALYGGDNAILGELKRVAAALREASSIDSALHPVNLMLDEGYLQMEDAALQLRDYSARIEADPEQLKIIEDRLDLLLKLKRKYAPEIAGIIELLKKFESELEELNERCSSKEELHKELDSINDELRRIGSDLTAARMKAAASLQERLSEESRQLSMPHALVQVNVEHLDEARANGFEKVEFLFSPNQGEEPRPLGRVASGGELSRLMLAFKQVLPEGEAPTLVFDEVDTGVGGAVAGVIGRKLRHLASRQQVFCVTHLPQVAAWSEQHIRIEKKVQDGRTTTSATLLDSTAKIQEVARMLAGEHITDSALQHAEEMINQAVL